jgi:hypothetical protein
MERHGPHREGERENRIPGRLWAGAEGFRRGSTPGSGLGDQAGSWLLRWASWRQAPEQWRAPRRGVWNLPLQARALRLALRLAPSAGGTRKNAPAGSLRAGGCCASAPACNRSRPGGLLIARLTGRVFSDHVCSRRKLTCERSGGIRVLTPC